MTEIATNASSLSGCIEWVLRKVDEEKTKNSTTKQHCMPSNLYRNQVKILVRLERKTSKQIFYQNSSEW